MVGRREPRSAIHTPLFIAVGPSIYTHHAYVVTHLGHIVTWRPRAARSAGRAGAGRARTGRPQGPAAGLVPVAYRVNHRIERIDTGSKLILHITAQCYCQSVYIVCLYG